MSTVFTHCVGIVPAIGRATTPPNARGIVAHVGRRLAALAAALVVHELPADPAYGRLLEGSGGKFTDALEREADRSLRESWDTLPRL